MDYPRLTPILRRLVLHAPNGLPAKAVAGLLGRDYNTLLAELGERSGHKAGVELLLPIMDTTGSCVPLDVLAEAMGGFFVHMPEVEGDCAALTGQCLASVREFGNLAPAVATQEATDGDSNWLPRQVFNAVTVAIPKARKLANGWRMTSVADALADGKITEKERRTIAEKGYSAQTAILALLRLVDASAVATQEATAEDSNWLPRR
ncbi:MAG: hypothetical protein K2J64_04655 [Desulfovibrio sp.]|nr:hypothetical protein [Desulfovibrio sp.]